MTYIDAQLAEDFAYERWWSAFGRSAGRANAEERRAYKDYADAFGAKTLIVQAMSYAVWDAVCSQMQSKMDTRRRLETALMRRRAFAAAAEKISD